MTPEEDQRLSPILRELHERLVRAGLTAHADRLEHLQRQDDLRSAFTSLEFWGGEDSIWSQEPAGEAHEFDDAILRLAQALEDVGWDTPRTRQIGLLLEDTHYWRTQFPEKGQNRP